MLRIKNNLGQKFLFVAKKIQFNLQIGNLYQGLMAAAGLTKAFDIWYVINDLFLSGTAQCIYYTIPVYSAKIQSL